MHETTSAREKILEVAGQLFFRHGYRAVGIDVIIEQSGVAKATLYRHFPSKDELIVAYLEETNRAFWAWFDAAANAYPNQPRQQLSAVFQALGKLVSTPTCYGCPFLIAATEFPDMQHPGHLVARQNKQAVQARLTELCAQSGTPDPQALGNQLHLIMDGAFMAARLYGVENPARNVGQYAEQMIMCALGKPALSE